MRNSSIVLSVFVLLLVTFGAPAVAEGPSLKVGYVPVTLRGEYQPLDIATVDALFLQSLKSSAPEIEFVPLQVDPSSFNPDAALDAARQSGVDLLASGTFSFELSSQNSRGNVFDLGRLKYTVVAIADVQVVTVADGDTILDQPTMVSSTDQSDAFTETGDPKLEQKLAKEGITEAAQTIVEVVRERRAGAATK